MIVAALDSVAAVDAALPDEPDERGRLEITLVVMASGSSPAELWCAAPPPPPPAAAACRCLAPMYDMGTCWTGHWQMLGRGDTVVLGAGVTAAAPFAVPLLLAVAELLAADLLPLLRDSPADRLPSDLLPLPSPINDNVG